MQQAIEKGIAMGICKKQAFLLLKTGPLHSLISDYHALSADTITNRLQKIPVFRR